MILKASIGEIVTIRATSLGAQYSGSIKLRRKFHDPYCGRFAVGSKVHVYIRPEHKLGRDIFPPLPVEGAGIVVLNDYKQKVVKMPDGKIVRPSNTYLFLTEKELIVREVMET